MPYVATGLDSIITEPYIPSPVFSIPSGFLKINYENMVLRDGDLVPPHALYAERLTIYSTDILADEEGNIILDENNNPTYIITESTACGTEPFNQITDCILDEHNNVSLVSTQSFFRVNGVSVCRLGDSGSCDSSHGITSTTQTFFSVNQA
jgi:hypothetical protein